MEEDILNYLPNVMFRGTPAVFNKKYIIQDSLLNSEKNK